MDWDPVTQRYVSLPGKRTGRVVRLDAADVRGSSWRVMYRPRRGRAVGFEDGHHQAVSGTGRRTPARGGSIK